jgi:hypothetical protein
MKFAINTIETDKDDLYQQGFCISYDSLAYKSRFFQDKKLCAARHGGKCLGWKANLFVLLALR